MAIRSEHRARSLLALPSKPPFGASMLSRLLLPFASFALGLMACSGSASTESSGSTATMEQCANPPCPPGPPAIGPGALRGPHADVVVRRQSDGPLDPRAFSTYEPAAPAPPSAPVVLFLHG